MKRTRKAPLFGSIIALGVVGLVVITATNRQLPSHQSTLRPKPSAASTPARAGAGPRLAAGFGQLPLSFEATAGQTDGQVKFLSRGRGYSLFLTGNEAVLSLRGGNQKSKGIGQMAKVEGRAHPLLLSPASFLEGATNNEQPTTPALPIYNLQSSIINSPAPSPESPDPSTVRLKLVGANPKAKVTGFDELPGKSNYFIGNDPKKWRTNVSNYAKVKYEGVYPGIDLVFYGQESGVRSQESGGRGAGYGQLEYDWVVAPGADPRVIALEVETGNSKLETGNSKLENRKPKIDSDGDLVIETDAGEMRLKKPTAYQPAADGGLRAAKRVNSQFTIQNSQFASPQYLVAFALGPYDKSRPLIIDPTISYLAYLGGSNYANGASAIAVDSSGNAYLIGTTSGTDFPVVNPLQLGTGTLDAFVTKVNSSGTALVYSTYLGGEQIDLGLGIAVDGAGSAYVTGSTQSLNFPTTPGAFQISVTGGNDVFVSKLNFAGSALEYSTYLGGSVGVSTQADDGGLAIAVDGLGSAYVTGYTNSIDFPTTAGAFRETHSSNDYHLEAFVTKFNAAGSALDYSTYLGGSDHDLAFGVAVDVGGSAYVTGSARSADFPTTADAFQTVFGGGSSRDGDDAFVTKLDPSGARLIFSTYLGGSSDDRGRGIALDAFGNVYVAGRTDSADFPTKNAFQSTFGGGGGAFGGDAFVTKLNPAGSALVYSTYLGGSSNESGYGIAVGLDGGVFLAGATGSYDFPTADAFQPVHDLNSDAFVTWLGADGSALVLSSYFGGSGDESAQGIASDTAGNMYVAGYTGPTDFLVTTENFNKFVGSNGTYPGGETDAFVLKISPGVAPQVGVSQISVTFPDQPAGTTSEGYAVTLGNFTSVPLTIDSIVAVNPDGTPTSDFYIDDHGCKRTYAVAERCTAYAYFSPQPGAAAALSAIKGDSNSPASISVGRKPPQGTTPRGTRIGKMRMATSISSASTIKGSARPSDYAAVTTSNTADIDLKGDALLPVVTLSPSSLTFSEQPVATTSTAQTVTLTNEGPTPLTIANVGTSAEFSQTNDCGTSVGAGGNCTISVTFSPLVGAARTGTLTITDDAEPSTQTVALSGIGTGGDFSIEVASGSTSSVTVNAGQTATYNLQLAPTGFSGTVALACAFQGTTPRETRCSVSPNSVTANGVDPVPFAVNVTTTARATVAPPFSSHPRGSGDLPMQPWARHVGPLMLGMLMMLMLAVVAVDPCFRGDDSRQPVRRPTLQWAPLAATLLAVLLWSACGGGGGTSPPPQQRGTPAGTYNLTLTGTAGGVSRTSALTLKVN